MTAGKDRDMLSAVVIILGIFTVLFLFGMCRAASDADDKMQELFREKGDKKV